jgi:crotonobetainyl-CoA:carnitine CoA-transferase CaiB-like acyl-CoA transferase
MAEAMGQPGLVDDPRFALVPDRELHWEQLWDEVEKWSVALDVPTVLDALRTAGCPCGPYRSVADVVDELQTESNPILRDAVDGAGDFQVPRSPLVSDQWPQREAPLRVPELGEDTVAVLRDVVGWPDDRIAALLAAGVSGG